MNVSLKKLRRLKKRKLSNIANPASITLSGFKNSSRCPQNNQGEKEDQDQNREKPSINLAKWDSEESCEKRIIHTIMVDRKERVQCEQRMELARQEFGEREQNLAQMMLLIDKKNNDLKVREAQVREIEPLIPSIKELQSKGLTLDLLMPIMMIIEGKASSEGLDLKTAAYNLTQDPEIYKTSMELHNTIKMLKQQVITLDTLAKGKEAVLTTLISLQRVFDRKK